MKKFQILILSLLLAGELIAQGMEVKEILKSGAVALSNYELEKAAKIYKDVLGLEPENTEAKEKLGLIYATPGPKQDINNAIKYFGDAFTSNAIKYYREAFTSGFMSPESILKYVNLLQSRSDYDKSRIVYNFYSNRGFSSNSLMRSIAADYYSKINDSNSTLSIKNVEDLNSPNSDFSPSYYRSGITFISTKKNRTSTGYRSDDEIVKNFTDIFKANLTNKVKGSFDASQLLLKAPNQKFMQGPLTFTDDYGVMYITRSTAKDGKSFTKEDRRTVLMEICKVNYSKGEVENWDDITPIVLNRGEGYQNYSYAHPAFITGRGDEMIFASNMPGGFGGNDLWYSRLVGSEWATPVNLGPEINTSGDEFFPYVAKDGSLYFASNGLPGLGGLDIYKAARIGDIEYEKLENLGVPINSKYDDFGYIVDETGREGYLSSNRPGGKGLDDIYSWKTNETPFEKNLEDRCKLVVIVLDKETNRPIPNTYVNIRHTSSGVEIGGIAKEDGSIKVKGISMNEFYEINATKTMPDGSRYIGLPESFMSKGLRNGDSIVKIVYLRRTGYLSSNRPVGKVLDDIYYWKTNKTQFEKGLEDRCKLVVIILDKETNQPIPNAYINIRQTSSNEEIDGIAKVDGSIKVRGIRMNEFYEINATKTMPDGSRYIGLPESAICKELRNGDSMVKIVYLRRTGIDTKIEIENILYDLDKWDIRPDAAIELDKIVSLLRQYPTMEIELGSHTDCRGTVNYNDDLSSKRAASCAEYIVSRGVAPIRLSCRGYGESQLKNGCACEGNIKSTCSEADHQKNRRTESKIIKF